MFVKNESKNIILLFRDVIRPGQSLELGTIAPAIQKMIDDGRLSVHKANPVKTPKPKKKPAPKKAASPPKKSEPENVDVQ